MKLGMFRIIVITIIINAFFCDAQAQNPDIMQDRSAESWTAFELRYYPVKNFKFGIEQQVRLNENVSSFDRTFTELNARYTLWKQLNIGFGYRYIFLNDNYGENQGIEKLYRLDYYISHKFDVNRLEIENRIKFQNSKEILDKSIRCLSETRNYWRLKSSFNYNIKDWKYDPFFSAEFLYPTKQRDKKLYNKYRLSLGTNIKVSKKQKLRLEYMFERELKSWNPEVNHIFQIKYISTIKRKTKKND